MELRNETYLKIRNRFATVGRETAEWEKNRFSQDRVKDFERSREGREGHGHSTRHLTAIFHVWLNCDNCEYKALEKEWRTSWGDDKKGRHSSQHI